MSFSSGIKNEILSQNMSKEEARSLVDGIFNIASVDSAVTFNSSSLREVVIELLDDLKIKYRNNSKSLIFEDYHPETTMKHPGYYFGGIFVARGSVSDIHSTTYHLEIQTSNIEVGREMAKFLAKYDIAFKELKRKSHTMFYLKSSTQILDFLKAIQAIKAVLALEDVMVSRDQFAMINRWTNLDVHNQSKLVKSNEQFVEQYNFIKQNKLQDQFRDIELKFFEIKLTNEFASLSELTSIFFNETGNRKTRSGLSHYLIKLRKVVKSNKKI